MTTVSEIDTEGRRRLESHRDWVWGSVESDASLDREDPGVALAVVRALLDDGIGPGETFKLQSLGAVFGDALATFLEGSWVAVEDEYGRDPAVQIGSSADLIFALTIISKRVEAAETIDVYELFERICVGIEARSR